MRTRALAVASVALVAAACGASPQEPRAPGPAAPAKVKASAPAVAPGTPALVSERIALVPDGTFGPYVGSRPEGTVAAWAAEVGGKRSWMTVAVSRDARRLAEPKTVADAAPEVDLVAMRPLGAGEVKELVLVSSSREFSGERVDALVLGYRGELVGGPVPLAQSLSDVVWLDAVATPSGALVFWAVRRDDRADLFAAALGPGGDVRERPSRVLEGARAWQVADVSGGAAIAAVTAGRARGEAGPLVVEFVDGSGHAEKKPLVVTEGGTAGPDVDLVRLGERLLVAWSDRRDAEPRLYSALVSGAGTLEKPPAPFGTPFGPQALVRLVSSPGGGAFVAWENLLERPDAGRAIRVTRVGNDGVPGPDDAILSMVGADAIPEMAATKRGLTALTLAPACRPGTSCEMEHRVPSFVTLDTGLDVVAAEPLRVAALNGAVADLAWGLSCDGEGCIALASGGEAPMPVCAVKLDSLGGAWVPPARRVSAAPPPRAVSLTPVGKSEPIAEVTVTATHAGTLVAWITDFDPTTPVSRSKTAAPDGKYEAPRAIVRVRSFPAGATAPEPVAISYRAQSVGGVSLAAGDPAKDEALLAWVGIDNKEPEVFVTLLGPGGKKISQKMLTHVKGGVADAAVAFVGDGYVVGWVEEKGGASEVHVVRLDLALKPSAPERRISGTASVATSVQLLARGQHVLAVWSDARGPDQGVADVYAVRLSAKDLAAVGPEHRLAQTEAHSRSPVLAPFGEGAVVGWIESPPRGGAPAAGSLMMVRLDSGGEPVKGSLATVTLDGDPAGLGLTCGNDSCRIAAVATAGEAGALSGFVWRPDGELRPRRILSLRTRPKETLAPALLGDDVFYADDTAAVSSWVRRLSVRWD